MPVKTICSICGSSYHYQTFCPQKKRKPISQRGRKAEQWEKFRDLIAIPYLDKKYGHKCSVKGCTATTNLDVDHIKPRGSHPQLRLDVKNLQYLCRQHHIEKTGTPQWSKTPPLPH